MLKFLRQYNQWILVVGGTLLLITFLMPSAIQSCAQQSAVSGAVWATMGDGTEITGADLAEAQQELRVIERLQNQTIIALGADKDPAYWWLLVHDAQQAGLMGDEGDGDAVLERMASGANIKPEQALFNIAQSSQTNADVVRTTLTKLQAVQRLVGLAASVDRVSDRRLERAVAESLLGVSGDLVVLNARTNTAIEAAAPTDAQLAEQLAKYADKPAPIGTATGFGYRLPDRFKLEWMSISKAAVAASVQNSPELATLELKKRFLQDPVKYSAPAGATLDSFGAFETTVRSKTVDELVAERLAEIAKYATDQLGLAQRSVARKGAYLELPADWASRMPSFQNLAQSVASEFAVELPSYQSTGESWITVPELESMPGVGRATTDRFGTPVRAPQLVGGAKELANPSLAAPFQLNIASPAMTADNGDVYFVRMIAAEASKPASDLATVRAEVERDVLAQERFKWLEANQAAITEQASTEGVRAVATKYGTEVQFARELREANPQFISYGIRVGTGIPGLGASDPKALRAIVEKAAKLPLTKDLSTVPLAERTIVVPAADQLALIVLQVTELFPVTEETYDQLVVSSPRLVEVARDPALAVNPKDIFSLDALEKRYGFKRSRGDEEIPTDAPAIPPL
jgi:hypothetical protein